jgi:hypothetical protein
LTTLADCPYSIAYYVNGLGGCPPTISELLGALLLVFLILWGLVQLPPVQHYLVHKITNTLSRNLLTKVEIGEVDLSFFKTIVLKDILIEDLQHDTLLAARKLGADIKLFSFFEENYRSKRSMLKMQSASCKHCLTRIL